MNTRAFLIPVGALAMACNAGGIAPVDDPTSNTLDDTTTTDTTTTDETTDDTSTDPQDDETADPIVDLPGTWALTATTGDVPYENKASEDSSTFDGTVYTYTYSYTYGMRISAAGTGAWMASYAYTYSVNGTLEDTDEDTYDMYALRATDLGNRQFRIVVGDADWEEFSMDCTLSQDVHTLDCTVDDGDGTMAFAREREAN